MNWSAGYVSEIDYVHGYYRELSPTLMRLACLMAAVAPPPARQIRYLELGFGQGLSISIHAAANEGEFYGTDFNPAHAANAQALTGASGAKAVLLDDSFEDFLDRSDAGEFDCIGPTASGHG
jgi:predicted O-methyltransferase YrrM